MLANRRDLVEMTKILFRSIQVILERNFDLGSEVSCFAPKHSEFKKKCCVELAEEIFSMDESILKWTIIDNETMQNLTIKNNTLLKLYK